MHYQNLCNVIYKNVKILMRHKRRFLKVLIIFMRYFFFHKIICQNAVLFVIQFVLNKRLSSWIIIYSIFSMCVQLHNNVFIKLLVLSSIHYIISSLEVLIFSSFSQKGHTNDTLKNVM